MKFILLTVFIGLKAFTVKAGSNGHRLLAAEPAAWSEVIAESRDAIRARLSRPKVRDRVLFLVIAGAVAVTTACGAQETGIDGDQAGARTQSSGAEQAQPQPNLEQKQTADPLTLILTSPSRCTTTRGQSYGVDEAVYDDEGNYLRTERRFAGHYEVKQFSVSWSVSGGDGPYALTIDGSTEDESGVFNGADGQGMVYCTNTTVPSFVDEAGDRALRAVPMIDSGTKAVRAVVTDAKGRTAEASIDVYVILRVEGTLDADGNDQVLGRGQTYRVAGHLITAPATHDVYIAGTAEPECPESLPEDERCEEEWGFGLVGLDAGVNLYRRDFAEASRWPDRESAAWTDNPNAALIDGLLDQLVDSVGRLPALNQNGQ